MNKTPTVLVVGGGIGGLAGAICLAASGFAVKLFEKNERLGGKLNIQTLAGEGGQYSFGTGPSLLTMPFVFDELFARGGIERSSVLDFLPLEPICRYFFSDGSHLNAFADKRRMMREIYSFASPKEALQYERFLRYTERIYNLAADIFMFTPFQEIQSLLKWKHLPTLFQLPRIDALRTVHQAVHSYFTDPRLIQMFDRYPTYNGSSPFRAPATLNIIPWVEYGLGGYYVRGGMYRLVEEMQRLALDLGVEIHTSQEVARILHKNNAVQEVEVNGTAHRAEYVLCNVDVVEAHNTLIAGYDARRKQLNRLEPSLSGMLFLWGMKQSFGELSHHNIFFSENYPQEFEQIFEQKIPPHDPTVYVSISSKTDPQHAPEGCENWFVLLNMPYLHGQNWAHEVGKMREAVFQRLKTSAGIDAASCIEAETVLSPEDFYALYRSNKGSIYGISSNSQWSAFLRPPNRSRQIRGLYFCGGSSHPGGGVPLVALSGMMAADLIAASEQQRAKLRRTL